MNKWTFIGIILAQLSLLSGCASTSLLMSKHNLDVQTKTSASVFLDPVSNSKKLVYVQIKNTSNQAQFDVKNQIVALLKQKGYRVTDNLNAAHYLLQANILQVGKTDPSAAKSALAGGYGSAVAGALAGGVAGAVIADTGNGALTGTLIGGVGAFIADNVVKDVTYSVITDVQISEKKKIRINETNHSLLQQGISGGTMQSSFSETNWQRYRTRILSSAEKVNLRFEQALPLLEKGLSQAIVGFF